MSTIPMNINDLHSQRTFALNQHSEKIERFFGSIPPMLTSQKEISDYLEGEVSNTPHLTCNGRVVSYHLDPASTWYVFPFLYVAVGEQLDDFRAAPLIPITFLKSAPFSHLSRNFYTQMSRYLAVQVTPPTPPVVEVLVDWQSGKMKATIGSSACPEVVEASGVQWRVGHGVGDVAIELPKKVVEKVTPEEVPRWTPKDFTDPQFYRDDAYAFVQRTHIPMAQEVLKMVPEGSYLIVPGDGTGLFAQLWSGPGVFGDPIVTANSHPRVQRENAQDTLSRANPGKLKPVVICSYISLFYSGDTLGYPSIWIDNPKIMDRVQGLVPLTEALYTRGFPGFVPVVLDRPNRRAPKPYHVPYLKNLLHLREFRISILSQAASVALRSSPCVVGGDPIFKPYVISSGSKFMTTTSPWLCPTVESMFGPDATSRGSCYFVPLGNFQDVDDAPYWGGVSPLESRRLYRVQPEDLYLVPSSCYVEKVFNQIFFAVMDTVRSLTRNVRYGDTFSRGVIPVVPRVEDFSAISGDDSEVDYEPWDPEQDVSSGGEEVLFMSPHDLQDVHVHQVLKERPLGSNQLREAIRSRWPHLVFSREQLLSILKGSVKYRMGPNYWSVSV